MLIRPPSPLDSITLRDDLPRYPPLLQICRVTTILLAGTPNIYNAFTQQVTTDTLLPRDREACAVNDLTGGGLAAGYYLCRLVGTYNTTPLILANNLPLYAVVPPSGGGGNTPVFHGAKMMVVNQTLGIDMDDFCLLDTPLYDSDGYCDIANHQIVIPNGLAGYYLISGYARWQEDGSHAGHRELTPWAVGIRQYEIATLDSVDDGVYGMSMAIPPFLLAVFVGDNLQLSAFANTGIAMTLERAILTAIWLGPWPFPFGSSIPYLYF